MIPGPKTTKILGKRKLSKEEYLEALKYDNLTKFQKLSKGSYKACVKNGWLNEIKIYLNNFFLTEFNEIQL